MEFHGRVYWTELMTRDLEAAKIFYADLCGWSYSTEMSPQEGYVVAQIGDGPPICGLGDMDSMGFDAAIPPHWFSYLGVEDIAAALETVRKGGGTVRRDTFAVPNVGKIAIVADPTGATVGLVEPEEGMAG